jgi:hypothetical protein
VHLAGAPGKPVWVLNRYDRCWRRLHGRSDSPWYPTARLFRQEAPGDRGVARDLIHPNVNLVKIASARRNALSTACAGVIPFLITSA